MKFNAWIILLFALASNSFSQKIQSPSEYFGYELGTYFTRHHQVVDYFKQLEKNAPVGFNGKITAKIKAPIAIVKLLLFDLIIKVFKKLKKNNKINTKPIVPVSDKISK